MQTNRRNFLTSLAAIAAVPFIKPENPKREEKLLAVAPDPGHVVLTLPPMPDGQTITVVSMNRKMYVIG